MLLYLFLFFSYFFLSYFVNTCDKKKIWTALWSKWNEIAAFGFRLFCLGFISMFAICSISVFNYFHCTLCFFVSYSFALLFFYSFVFLVYFEFQFRSILVLYVLMHVGTHQYATNKRHHCAWINAIENTISERATRFRRQSMYFRNKKKKKTKNVNDRRVQQDHKYTHEM